MRRCDVKFTYYVDSTKTKIEKLENKNSIYTSQNIYPLQYIINQDYKTSYHNRFHNLNSQEKESEFITLCYEPANLVLKEYNLFLFCVVLANLYQVVTHALLSLYKIEKIC